MSRQKSRTSLVMLIVDGCESGALPLEVEPQVDPFAVAVLGHHQQHLLVAGGVGGVLLLGLVVEEEDDVGVLLDGAGVSLRSDSTGRLRFFSLSRLSWEIRMTGTFRSLAMILKARVISEISLTRFSFLPLPLMSCR